jgi:hypothetical protein
MIGWKTETAGREGGMRKKKGNEKNSYWLPRQRSPGLDGGDIPEALENETRRLFQVQGVHVEVVNSNVGITDPADHVHGQTNTKLLDGLVVVLDGLELLVDEVRDLGLAEGGHALKSGKALDGHDARKDRNSDT